MGKRRWARVWFNLGLGLNLGVGEDFVASDRAAWHHVDIFINKMEGISNWV